MKSESVDELKDRIKDLENRLAESEQLIEAIKAGEVDAFAVNENNGPEIYTLQSGDYAYRVLIEEIGEGAVNITEDGMIVYTNSCFTDLMKLPYEKVIGSPIIDFIHPDSRMKFNALFREAFDRKSKGEINLFIHQQIIPVYVSLTSLQPKLATIGMIITDHSSKKKHEETILQYQKELEAKNSELAQNNLELTSFTYIASHDLQEPLRKIQTFCNRILENKDEILSPANSDYFKRILSASARMQNLISSLLSYSRMNTRNMEFETVDLNSILDDVITNNQELIEENNASVKVGLLPVITGIPTQLNQLFTNLIINSIKYKKPDEPPTIQIDACQVALNEKKSGDDQFSPDHWKITITDNGIGFESKYAEKIFELFQRLHSRFEYEGTGIGLAICKKIVQNHKGQIRAIGEPGHGAVIEVYLPLTRIG
jgi:PAS domain S-box-containing protein